MIFLTTLCRLCPAKESSPELLGRPGSTHSGSIFKFALPLFIRPLSGLIRPLMLLLTLSRSAGSHGRRSHAHSPADVPFGSKLCWATGATLPAEFGATGPDFLIKTTSVPTLHR